MRKVLAKLQRDPAKTVFVSGIGCSSRFPYYMNTYGFHSIHGRAPTFATGLKLARPDLDVWLVTGDGDGLSIGGNHLLHIIRRNPNVKVLLFNNRIYGLTKGQFSPTSEKGKKTKTSPMGSLENPLRPLSLAVSAGATFVARTLDRDLKHMEYVLERAARHEGLAFVEIYQNCLIFNDGTFESLTEKETKAETTLTLEHGKPLVFGKNREKGIRLENLRPVVCEASDPNVYVHNESDESPMGSFMLANFSQPELPEPMGVLRAVEGETFEKAVHEQLRVAKEQKGGKSLQSILEGGESWVLG
jgi:2-oxoglutarate ferredoxin oxidoreductase subunit beta